MQFSSSHDIIHDMNIAERIRAARVSGGIEAKRAQKQREENTDRIVNEFNAQILADLKPIIQVVQEASIEDILRTIGTVATDLRIGRGVSLDYSYYGPDLFNEYDKHPHKRLVGLSLWGNNIEEVASDFDLLRMAYVNGFFGPHGYSPSFPYYKLAYPEYQDHAFSRPRYGYHIEWDRYSSSSSSEWKFMSIQVQPRRYMPGVEIVLAGDEDKKSDTNNRLRITNPAEWRSRASLENKIFTIFQHHPGHGNAVYSDPRDSIPRMG